MKFLGQFLKFALAAIGALIVASVIVYILTENPAKFEQAITELETLVDGQATSVQKNSSHTFTEQSSHYDSTPTDSSSRQSFDENLKPLTKSSSSKTSQTIDFGEVTAKASPSFEFPSKLSFNRNELLFRLQQLENQKLSIEVREMMKVIQAKLIQPNLPTYQFDFNDFSREKGTLKAGLRVHADGLGLTYCDGKVSTSYRKNGLVQQYVHSQPSIPKTVWYFDNSGTEGITYYYPLGARYQGRNVRENWYHYREWYYNAPSNYRGFTRKLR
ncbi:MAG: hypothetical protein VW875_00240 [Planctomycetaceae bacterium]